MSEIDALHVFRAKKQHNISDKCYKTNVFDSGARNLHQFPTSWFCQNLKFLLTTKISYFLRIDLTSNMCRASIIVWSYAHCSYQKYNDIIVALNSGNVRNRCVTYVSSKEATWYIWQVLQNECVWQRSEKSASVSNISILSKSQNSANY